MTSVGEVARTPALFDLDNLYPRPKGGANIHGQDFR
jgi:hypothetical protein